MPTDQTEIDHAQTEIATLKKKQKKLLKKIATLEKHIAELEIELMQTRYLQQEIGVLKIAELTPGYQMNN